jgi:hypothetical protein
MLHLPKRCLESKHSDLMEQMRGRLPDRIAGGLRLFVGAA